MLMFSFALNLLRASVRGLGLFWDGLGLGFRVRAGFCRVLEGFHEVSPWFCVAFGCKGRIGNSDIPEMGIPETEIWKSLDLKP